MPFSSKVSQFVRPRRPDDAIVSYMLSMYHLIEEAHNDNENNSSTVNDGSDDESNGRVHALQNVVAELKFQTASVIVDKRTATILERLVEACASRDSATRVLHRCVPYAAFIAHNRYGSHVLQTCLGFIAGGLNSEFGRVKQNSSNESGVVDDVDDEEDKLDSVEVVVSFWHALVGLESYSEKSSNPSMNDIAQNLMNLMCDPCATHVLRSLLCLIGGFEHKIAESREVFKPSRESWSRKANTGGGNSNGVPAVYVPLPEADVAQLRPLWAYSVGLLSADHALSGVSAPDLQQLALDPNGAPSLVTMLEIEAAQNRSSLVAAATAAAANTTAPDAQDWSNQAQFGCLTASASAATAAGCIPYQHPSLPAHDADRCVPTCQRIVERLLQWTDESASGDVIYAIAGEKSASHLLERILRFAPADYMPVTPNPRDDGGGEQESTEDTNAVACDAGTAGGPGRTPFLEELTRRGVLGAVSEFVEHDVAHHALQTLLRCWRDAETFRALLLPEMLAALPSAMASGRLGVVWRLAECALRLSERALDEPAVGDRKEKSKKQKKSRRRQPSTGKSRASTLGSTIQVAVAAAILQSAAAAQKALSPALGAQPLPASIAERAVTHLLSAALPSWLTSSDSSESASKQQGEAPRERLKLNVAGARTIAVLLRFTAPIASCCDKGLQHEVDSNFFVSSSSSSSSAAAAAARFPSLPIKSISEAQETLLEVFQGPQWRSGKSKRWQFKKSGSLPSNYLDDVDDESVKAAARVRTCVAAAIASLPIPMPCALAMDSLGSRCILQPLLNTEPTGSISSNSLERMPEKWKQKGKLSPGESTEEGDERPEMGGAMADLVEELTMAVLRQRVCLEGLKGRWATVGADAVGQHTLRVAFECAPDLAIKAAITRELAATSSSNSNAQKETHSGGGGGGKQSTAKSILSRTHAGRATMRLVSLDAFLRRREDWDRTMSRSTAAGVKERQLQLLGAQDVMRSKASHAAEGKGDSEKAEDAVPQHSKKKERNKNPKKASVVAAAETSPGKRKYIEGGEGLPGRKGGGDRGTGLHSRAESTAALAALGFGSLSGTPLNTNSKDDKKATKMRVKKKTRSEQADEEQKSSKKHRGQGANDNKALPSLSFVLSKIGAAAVSTNK